MQHTENGMISSYVLILLFVLSGIAIGMGYFTRFMLQTEKRIIIKEQNRKKMLFILGKIEQSLKDDPTPDINSKDDPVWNWNKANEKGIKVAIHSASSNLNPNFVRRNLFDKTALSGLFVKGQTPDSLQQYREENGLSMTYTAYKTFFSEKTFQRFFSCYGWANINLTDEFAARALGQAITGRSEVGERLRSIIQQVLEKHQIVNRTQLRTILGSDYETLFPFINAEPVMNINFTDELLLREIICYPEYKIKFPKTKCSELLALRDTSGISEDDIVRILEIDDTNRLYYYFGSISWFWEIVLSGENTKLEAVICRVPLEDGNYSDKPEYKIIEERFQ